MEKSYSASILIITRLQQIFPGSIQENLYSKKKTAAHMI